PSTPATDGETDFVVVNGRRQIRWYGLPRDGDGDGIILGWTNGRTANQLIDIVPLRDVVRTNAGWAASPGAPFERFTNFTPAPTPDPTLFPRALYADPLNPTAGMQSNEYCTCAWGPNDTIRPKLIRITMVIDDPAGRLGDGKTFEFIFPVP